MQVFARAVERAVNGKQIAYYAHWVSRSLANRAIETSLEHLAGIETLSQPLPASVDDSLQLIQVGFAHVRLSWDPATDAAHYVLRRSTSPNFSSPIEIGATEATTFEDINVASDGNLYFYRVFSANACGQEAP